ncbi:hypothetical protein CFC21_024253, partial [Triticum aestivum]
CSSPGRSPLPRRCCSRRAAARTAAPTTTTPPRGPRPRRSAPRPGSRTRRSASSRCGREMDNHFNTSKSNKHLWEAISAKMREQGFDRSPTMCTDKWRNLLKEFKKARSHARSSAGAGGNGSAKMAYYKEIDDLLKRRGKAAASPAGSGGGGGAAKSPTPTSKIESYLQFADKGFEDANIPFGPVEASHPLALTTADAVATNGVNPWNWRDTSTNGGDNQGTYGGRVILVKWGDYTKRIGIDGTAEAIKEAIKSAFGLRTRRAFWLEDEDEVVRSLDRDMPVGG